jgi:hypothetical protein
VGLASKQTIITINAHLTITYTRNYKADYLHVITRKIHILYGVQRAMTLKTAGNSKLQINTLISLFRMKRKQESETKSKNEIAVRTKPVQCVHILRFYLALINAFIEEQGR